MAASPAQAVANATVVISMLPASRHVESLYLGASANELGLLQHIKPGTLVIDCSTIAPASSRKIASAAQALDIVFIDAPVSGGTAGAAAGTLSFIVANLPIGTRVPIEIIRNGRRQTLTATVGRRPAEEELAAFADEEDEGLPPENNGATATPSAAPLGLQLVPLTPQISRNLRLAPDVRGVVIASVDPSSDAANKGLRRGMVIQSVNQQPVATTADVAGAVGAARRAGRNSVLLFVQQARGPGLYLAVDID